MKHLASIQNPTENNSESYQLFKRCWKWTKNRFALMLSLRNDFNSVGDKRIQDHILLFASEAEDKVFKELILLQYPNNGDYYFLGALLRSKNLPLLERCLKTFKDGELPPEYLQAIKKLAVNAQDNNNDNNEEDLNEGTSNMVIDDQKTLDELKDLESYAQKLLSNGKSKKSVKGKTKGQTVLNAIAEVNKKDDDKLKACVQQLTQLLKSGPNKGIRVNRGTGGYLFIGLFKGVKNPFDDRYSRSTTETRTILAYNALKKARPECFEDAGKDNVLEMK